MGIADVATKEIFDMHYKENVSHVLKYSGPNVETSVTQDEIMPSDSVSNTGSRGSGKWNSTRSRSSVSTTSSARIKAEADMAALIA